MSREQIALDQINAWINNGGVLPSGIEKNQLATFVCVESSGTPFDNLNRPIIRFEVHLFFDAFGKNHSELFNQHFQFSSTTRWKEHKYRIKTDGAWINLHIPNGNQLEWEALTLACGIALGSFDPAIESASYGLGQVLGAHWKRLGYTSPDEFFKSTFDVDNQVQHMVKFIETDSRLLNALKTKDWKTVAKYYNGSGQVAVYSGRLEAAYRVLGGVV